MTQATTPASASLAHLRSKLLRGGRLTKVNGIVASFAPQVGELTSLLKPMVLAVSMALGGAMLAPSAAWAGSCTETPGGSGNWLCSGVAVPGTDLSVNANPAVSMPVTITTQANFGIDTSTTPSETTPPKTNAINANINVGLQGSITFTDIHNSTIIGRARGLSLSTRDGSLTVNSNGLIRGKGINDSALVAVGNGTGSNMDLRVNSVFSDGLRAIFATNNGDGNTSVLATGTLTSSSSNVGFPSTGALHVTNALTAGNVRTESNIINAARDGINITNNGRGDTSVTSLGPITAGTVNTAGSGISVTTHTTSKTATIVANGNIYGGSAGRGISLTHSGSGLATISTTGTVTGGTQGISATNNGTNALSISSTGTVTATANGSSGIFAQNNTKSTDLTIKAANTTGVQFGIQARNDGNGAMLVESSGTATATSLANNANGIFALNSTSGKSLTITANNTTGGGFGLYARNRGSGELNITSTGLAQGTGPSGRGIDARNTNNFGQGLTLMANEATGVTFGIIARNYATGTLNVTSTGKVTATGPTGRGIYARNSVTGTDLKVTAAYVTGGEFGVDALLLGMGSTNVKTTDTVTGTTNAGIRAQNTNVNSQDLTIDAVEDVTGGKYGINALNNGRGVLNITTGKSVTGTATGSYGIKAVSKGTDLTIDTTKGAVSGLFRGIFANNNGAGALSITTGASVTATGTAPNTVGIQASNNSGTDLTIDTTAGTVSGYTIGITAFNNGGGELSITTGKSVTATAANSIGIDAFNFSTGSSSLTIDTSAGAVSGGKYGLDTRNNGSGALSITTGDVIVNGIIGHGIRARNYANGADLVIDTSAGAVSGGRYGIKALNYGRGELSITTAGVTVTPSNSTGIIARNYAAGTDLTIDTSAGAVSGGLYGINALNNGSGVLSITTSDVTGTAGRGISASNSVTGMTLDVRAVNVTGGTDGIFTSGLGTGPSTVSVTGAIQGGTGFGINTFTQVGKLTTIDVASTATVGATSGNAIQNNLGDSVLNVASGGIINGRVMLDKGNDSANINGATALAGITLLDGGDDASSGDGMIDVLTLNGVTQTLNGGQIVNWEVINLNVSTITGELVTETLNVCAGSTTLNGNSAVTDVLGCAAPDSITVTGNTVIANAIEGAGGADTINVLGNASVLTVHGGANGQAPTSALDDVGDSITINTTGTVGAVYGDLGGDLLTLSDGTIGLASGGDGNDIIVLQGADVTGAITGDAGIDTFILTSGTAGSVSGGDGDDTITLQGADIAGAIIGDAGNETMSLTSGTAGSVSGGDGDDLIVAAGADIAGAVAGDAGDDELSLTAGTIGGGLLGGAGDDTLEVNGGTLVGGALGGAGTDVLGLVGGTLDFASGGDGNDAFQLDGATVTGGLSGDAGDDTFALTSGTAASVSGGDGDDIVALAGAAIAGAITGDAGNDTITLTSGSAGSVEGNDGDDTINWNATNLVTPLVQGGLGSDTVNINTAAAPISTGVVLDGGSGVNGTDTLNLNAAWSGSLVGANTTNWEVININGGTVKFSDAAITAGVINVNTVGANAGKLDASNNLIATTNVAVGAGAFLMAGNTAGTNVARIIGNLTNDGTVDMRGPAGQNAAGDTLTVTGNLDSTPGSSFEFDTVLGGSNATDLITVEGDLTGSSRIVVNNVGGTGSLTTDAGIKLIDVNGPGLSTAALALANPLKVGLFNYTLKQGGNGGDAKDWYLLGTYNAAIPGYVAGQRANMESGFTQISTLHQRMGEQRHADGEQPQLWMRLIADKDRSTGSKGWSTSQNSYGMQLGADLVDYTTASGNNARAGLSVNYLHSNADFKDGTRGIAGFSSKTGSMDSNNLGLGAYYTNMAKDGTYLDLVGSIGRLRDKYSNLDTGHATQRGWQTNLSAEVGKPIYQSQNGWQIEPQAQLIYQHTRYQGFNDSEFDIDGYNTDQVRGRVGVRLFKDDETTSRLNNYYVIANLVHDFMGADEVEINNTEVGQRYDRTRAEIGAGAQSKLTSNSYFYADARYNKSLDGNSEGGQANIGLKVEW